LQNSLGTIEGAWQQVLEEMKKVAKEYDGEIIICFLRRQALETYGMELYNRIQEMTEEPDLEKTDFTKGQFVSKTGYSSKWRSKKEIQDIIDFFEGKVINEHWTDIFVVLHLKA